MGKPVAGSICELGAKQEMMTKSRFDACASDPAARQRSNSSHMALATWRSDGQRESFMANHLRSSRLALLALSLSPSSIWKTSRRRSQMAQCVLPAKAVLISATPSGLWPTRRSWVRSVLD